MKAQLSTPTPIANTGRSRTIVVLFVGLLVLAVAIIGSVLALSQRTPAAEIAARGPANHALIAHCRVCQDEALAARQGLGLAGEWAAPSVVAATPSRALMINCQVCRDEALGAAQASAPSLLPVRSHVVRSRIFQDELIAAAQSNLVPLAIPSNTIDQQLDDLHRPGPR